VHCVDRGNVYYCAGQGGRSRPATDWSSYFKGKSLALSQFGGTPELDHPLSLEEVESRRQERRDPVEVANSAVLAVVKSKQAQIACRPSRSSPRGCGSRSWSEPFYNIPKELGPYAYSTLNVRLDSIQKDPELVRAFVRGMVKGLKFTYAQPDAAADVAKKNFPTMPLEDLKATLDRSFRDEMWSKDGMITRRPGTPAAPSCATPHSQVRRQVRGDHRHELRRERAHELVTEALMLRRIAALFALRSVSKHEGARTGDRPILRDASQQALRCSSG